MVYLAIAILIALFLYEPMQGTFMLLFGSFGFIMYKVILGLPIF